MGNIAPGVAKILVVSELVDEINKHTADIIAYRAALSAHVHAGTDGVGAAPSGAGPAAITLTCALIPNTGQLSTAQKAEALKAGLNLLKTDIGTFRTAFTAHAHTGVTAGGSNSGAAATVALTIATVGGSLAGVGYEQAINTLVDQYNSLYTQFAALNTAMGAHTHLVNAGVASATAIAALAAQTSATMALISN